MAGSALRRIATLAVPVAVDVAMPVVFRHLAGRLGPRRGYIAGFAVYWGACVAIPVAILGRRRTASLLADARRPRPLEVVVLALPPVGGLVSEALPAIRAGVRVDGPVLAMAGAFAATNAVAEELLWRGLFLETFPGAAPADRVPSHRASAARGGGWAAAFVAGRVYPAVGFGLWHLAPQQVHPSRRPLAFCAAAAELGLVNGWAASRLGGIRAVSVSHALADATGLRSFARMLGR